MHELSKKRYVSHIVGSLVPVGLGNKDQAFEHFEKAFIDRDPQMIVTIQFPMWDSIRSDARFKEILKKLGLE